MKIRMLFGTYHNPGEDRPRVDLEVGSIQDLPEATAAALIAEGRAEATEPVPSKTPRTKKVDDGI